MKYSIILILTICLCFFSCARKEQKPTMKASITEDGKLKLSDKSFNQQVAMDKEEVKKLIEELKIPLYPNLTIDSGMIRTRGTTVTFCLNALSKDSPETIEKYYKEKIPNIIKSVTTDATSIGNITTIKGEGDIYLFTLKLAKTEEGTSFFLSGRK